MKTWILPVICLAAGGIPAPLFAQAASQPTQAQPSTATTATAADPIICEKQEVIGSRLSHKRVCMTRSQWEDARSQDRSAVEKVQTQRVLVGKEGG